MNRRHFLQQVGYFSATAIVTAGTHGWAFRSQAQTRNPKRLIVVFLRGAVDGLSVVIPYQEAAYYNLRSRIAIPRPGQEGGALSLDSRFGLHPALKPLLPFWQQGNLAFVHACGSPNQTRSHFEAQDYMETGTPGIRTTSEGWMNRLLATLPGRNPVQAISLGATTPRILAGRMPVANLPLGRGTRTQMPVDRPQVSAAFDRLYQGQDALSQAYQEGQEARQTLMANLQEEMQAADNGAPPAIGLAQITQRLAGLMVRDPKIQLAFLGVGGWDTHVNQGGSRGQLATRLGFLGQGLATLAKGLGSVYRDTAIVVLSEFGRTVRENGNGGTDHGHGNVLWVLGGAIRGGKVYGDWPGLAPAQLYEGRDLAVTTDFRDGIAALLQGHLGLGTAEMAQVFPGYAVKRRLELV